MLENQRRTIDQIDDETFSESGKNKSALCFCHNRSESKSAFNDSALEISYSFHNTQTSGILHLVSVTFCLISSKFRTPFLSTLSNPSISSPSPNLLICPLHLQLVPLFSNQTQTRLCPCSTLFSLYDREPWMCSTKTK